MGHLGQAYIVVKFLFFLAAPKENFSASGVTRKVSEIQFA